MERGRANEGLNLSLRSRGKSLSRRGTGVELRNIFRAFVAVLILKARRTDDVACWTPVAPALWSSKCPGTDKALSGINLSLLLISLIYSDTLTWVVFLHDLCL